MLAILTSKHITKKSKIKLISYLHVKLILYCKSNRFHCSIAKSNRNFVVLNRNVQSFAHFFLFYSILQVFNCFIDFTMKLHWKVNIAYFSNTSLYLIQTQAKTKALLHNISIASFYLYFRLFFANTIVPYIQYSITWLKIFPTESWFDKVNKFFFSFSSIKIRFATILPLTSTFADTCEILLIFSKCYIQFCNHLMIDLTHLMLLVTHGKIHGYFLLNSLLFRAFSFVECVLRLSDSLNFIWCAGARRSRS